MRTGVAVALIFFYIIEFINRLAIDYLELSLRVYNCTVQLF